MSQQSYVPLHVHTEFSLLDGAIKIKDYLDFAKKEGWVAASITDHGNIFGAVKFFQTAAKFGVKPILGCEMYFVPDVDAFKTAEKKYFHLTLLVKNEKGYANLCRLMAFSYQKGFYFKPRIDFNILRENSEGLIISGGCQGGLIPSLLLEKKFDEAEKYFNEFISIIGRENFYLEVMPPDTAERDELNKLTFEFGKKHDVLVVATPDSHFLLPEHKFAHEVMLCVGTKHLMTDKDRFSFGDFQGHLKTTKEMLEAFPENPECVWNSGLIAEKCEFKFKFGELCFPAYEIPEGFTEKTYFAKLCKDGLDRIFELGIIPKNEEPAYIDRLNVEIDLIVKMGFISYFLVVNDFVAWSKRNGVPVGPGRGSAAGSLVSWALEITNIDPIKYNLLFERFLNPERVTMPDMDIDFCILGRERVISYVKQKYGEECVCQIITFGTMAAKGSVKDVARVLGLSFAESQTITDLIPEQLKISLKESLEQEPLLKKLIAENEKVKQVYGVAQVLEGVTRHASKHAAGVVISPKPLKDVVPLYIPPKTTDLVTQYAMTELESVGFLKMDFLGLKNLTVVDQALRAIKKRYGIDINLDKLHVDDPKAFEILGQGKTAGIFQFEGSGVTEVLVKLKPEKFEDLIAVNALYRPGPLSSGMVDDFIGGRHGTKEPVYLFEELRSALEETYGVIVYQEQVMKISYIIAGYSLGEADLLRRAMGKKKPEEMAKQKSIFLAGAEKKGFNLEKADRLFELMAYFAGYGFNKSHSAAYALIAYHTAYLKAHYPKEFIAATLSFETSDPDKLKEYLQKASEMDVRVLPPDINKSEIEFSAVDEGVLFGLSGIKNVGEAVLHQIIESRQKDGPFASFLDFCRRVSLRTANKRVLESLIYSGAMDLLPGSRAQKIAKIEFIISKVSKEVESKKTGQTSLFSFFATQESPGATPTDELVFDDIPEFDLMDKLEKEKETLGFYLSAHPLDGQRNFVELLEFSGMAFKNYDEVEHDALIGVFGVATAYKTVVTKTGNKMAFLNFADVYNHQFEVIVFPKVFAKYESFLNENGSYFVLGNFERVGTKLKIKADRIISPNDAFNTKISDLKYCFVPKKLDQATISALKQCLVDGNTDAYVELEENGKKLSLAFDRKVSLNFDLFKNIENIVQLKVVFDRKVEKKAYYGPRS